MADELDTGAKEIVELLAAMGFSELLALNAVRQTRGANVDAAMSWIEEHQGDESASATLLPLAPAFPQMAPPQQREHKVMLVVRDDLGMSLGKACAQCAHAAVGLYQRAARTHSARLAAWEASGQKKIVVRARDLQELERLAASAGAAGLPTYVVLDAGRTEVAAGSATVLAIGPANDDEVNPITGELSLLQ